MNMRTAANYSNSVHASSVHAVRIPDPAECMEVHKTIDLEGG